MKHGCGLEACVIRWGPENGPALSSVRLHKLPWKSLAVTATPGVLTSLETWPAAIAGMQRQASFSAEKDGLTPLRYRFVWSVVVALEVRAVVDGEASLLSGDLP
jgi:hypothetical protein